VLLFVGGGGGVDVCKSEAVSENGTKGKQKGGEGKGSNRKELEKVFFLNEGLFRVRKACV
jgi:hypothetical protein